MRPTSEADLGKTRTTITIDMELVKWVEKEIEKHRFASVSHAIEFALQQLKDEPKNSRSKE